jgi:hypothetical protein
MSFADTRLPLIVLDKNRFRGAAATAAKARADAAGCGVLVIDTTIKEIARHGDFADHFEKDFRDWTDKPDRISFSWGIGEVLRHERETNGVMANIVDTEMTRSLRAVLSAVASGNESIIKATKARADNERTDLTASGGALNAAERTSMMRRMVKFWWDFGSSLLRQAIIDELNDPTEGPLIVVGRTVLTDTMRDLLQGGMQQAGYSETVARTLLSLPTFTTFLHCGFEAYSLVLWAQGQRLDPGVNEERFLTQMLDLDYIAYSLCCSGFESNETLMNRIEAGLRRAAASKWSDYTG